MKTSAAIRRFISNTLAKKVEGDARFYSGCLASTKGMNEHTLQALIWHHLTTYAGDGWAASIEDTVPVVGKKADIILWRVKEDGKRDRRGSVIAIEVKPKGLEKSLVSDINKLASYVNKATVPIDFGVLVYMSRQGKKEEGLMKLADKKGKGRIVVVRINPSHK